LNHSISNKPTTPPPINYQPQPAHCFYSAAATLLDRCRIRHMGRTQLNRHTAMQRKNGTWHVPVPTVPETVLELAAIGWRKLSSSNEWSVAIGTLAKPITAWNFRPPQNSTFCIFHFRHTLRNALLTVLLFKYNCTLWHVETQRPEHTNCCWNNVFGCKLKGS
jgi:hypothetical protein